MATDEECGYRYLDRGSELILVLTGCAFGWRDLNCD